MKDPFFPQPDDRRGERRDHMDRLLLIDELAHQLKASFFDVVHEQLRHATLIPSPVKRAIVERNLDVPMIETYTDPKDIGMRLDQLGFEHVISRLHFGDALCVIHLPATMKHLPYYHETSVPPKNVYDLSAETYARCIDALWDTARSFCQKHGRELYRLNAPGEHKITTDGFYYVWIIRLKHLEAIPFNNPLDEPFEEDE